LGRRQGGGGKKTGWINLITNQAKKLKWRGVYYGGLTRKTKKREQKTRGGSEKINQKPPTRREKKKEQRPIEGQEEVLPIMRKGKDGQTEEKRGSRHSHTILGSRTEG